MNQMEIRPIAPSDNAELAKVIRRVLLEFDVPRTGTAYADPELDRMYETYKTSQSQYWVVVNGDQIVGGAGVAPLQEGPAEICELQKMYFDPSARGVGLGANMMRTCLDFAQKQGFKKVYLETLPQMVAAQKLYAKFDFNALPNALGNTGHCNCSVWMLKDIGA